MKVRVQLDADVHGALAEALRKRGYDAINAAEANRLKIGDEEQLVRAAAERRTLVTFYVKHFVELHNQFARACREHFGIIVSQQIPIGAILRKLLGEPQTRTADDLFRQLRFLR